MGRARAERGLRWGVDMGGNPAIIAGQAGRGPNGIWFAPPCCANQIRFRAVSVDDGYDKLPLVSGMMKLPTKKTTEITNKKIDKTTGKFCGVGDASDTKVGIRPPIAKPIFQDNPVPVERRAVGNLSFRKISNGA